MKKKIKLFQIGHRTSQTEFICGDFFPLIVKANKEGTIILKEFQNECSLILITGTFITLKELKYITDNKKVSTKIKKRHKKGNKL